MIASLRGTLESKAPDRLVVNVGGVGLRVLVPGTVVEDVGSIGEEVYLLTHLQVREDALTLYGFTSPEQLRLFELLITVNGVGPGSALGILSTGGPQAVEQAIASENADYFSRVPRVGKKIAQRVVLELKNKVQPVAVGAAGFAATSPANDDTLAALVGLGYTAGEAQAAIRSLPADEQLSEQEKILRALAYFNRA